MPTTRPVQAQPDPDRVVPHLAMRALVSLRAVDACLDAIDGPHREGALRALRSMHEPKAVEGLIKKLSTARSPEARRDILATLVRLYHREADYRRELVGHPARHDRPVLRPAGVGEQRADRLGPQGGRPRRRRRDRDVPPRRTRPAACPPQGPAGRRRRPTVPKAEEEIRVAPRQGRPEEPGPDRQHDLRSRGEAGTPGEGRCGARQEPCSPRSRAAPATPTPTARRPRGRTSWTSASATAPPSSWSRS